ncbi:MAG: four helix bundle protein [Bdellovibrionales bacterium]|nr:four helix bundle protein [Bdellovibrionales bacterium]
MKTFFTLDLAIQFHAEARSMKLPGYLRDQFLRASSSVAMNLSEGSAKPTKADRKKFYFIALGSIRECQTILKLHGCSETETMKRADFLGACVYKLCKSMG